MLLKIIKESSMTKTKLIDYYTRLSDLEAEKRDLNSKVKSLDAEAKSIKEILTLEIPANSSKNNVFHKVTEKPVISYAKLYSAVLDDLVPKTKYSQAETLKESFTSITESHTFKLEA